MAENWTINMSIEEINRCQVLRMVDERKITQKTGARRIGVTDRHFRRFLQEAFYTDRFSVFRVNQPNITTTDAQTQFERSIAELGIELICASSPQAKCFSIFQGYRKKICQTCPRSSLENVWV